MATTKTAARSTSVKNPRVVKATAGAKPKALSVRNTAAAKLPAKAGGERAVKKPAAENKPAPAVKPTKPRLVRDSFTMPKSEYAVIDALKQRGATLAWPLKKSELLRAGIKALAAMGDADFLAAVKAVPSIKTGRPKGANL